MFHVYILKSRRDAAYYIGSCKDIATRLTIHNSGHVRSTKRGIPWDNIYQEQYDNLPAARRREAQLKSWKSRAALERLIKHQKK